MATWIVGGALALAVLAIIRIMARDKKEGRNACGGDCAHCCAGCSRHARKDGGLK